MEPSKRPPVAYKKGRLFSEKRMATIRAKYERGKNLPGDRRVTYLTLANQYECSIQTIKNIVTGGKPKEKDTDSKPKAKTA